MRVHRRVIDYSKLEQVYIHKLQEIDHSQKVLKMT